ARLVEIEAMLGEREASLAETALDRDEQAGKARALAEELETLRRRRGALQAELNDAHHELYDVRRALNLRIEEIEGLRPKVAELAEVRAKGDELEAQLAALRDELADKLHALANAESARENVALDLAQFRTAHET